MPLRSILLKLRGRRLGDNLAGPCNEVAVLTTEASQHTPYLVHIPASQRRSKGKLSPITFE